MTNKVIHLAHCIYIGSEIEYEWVKSVDAAYHDLPNLYAISLLKASGNSRKALATVLLKTNLGQTKEEIGQLYGAMADIYPKLQNLPTKDVILVSTKVNVPSGVILNEAQLLELMTDMYTQNATGGNA
ncbi:hypothetical protein R7E46_01915 [Vibrio sp. Vb2704]|uniref:hypothetical protein n=1 Tax=Vibrio TaxID=662 RepID=UPI00084B8FE6|nr:MULTISPECIES: hypothetical protein [Vibrio]EGQ8156797.1 hypothetical protein [Vibrio alginolyticus]EKP4441961.1 hypothetical protein [Vibrio alginolyticus]MCR9600751.1 hypothetical protein [Vibrio alginolyticus]MCR9602043.1 hypothetical protein [Vibrio alginolyticus]MDW1622295.1 hypothetical protein [Vibrio sp. Vb2704]